MGLDRRCAITTSHDVSLPSLRVGVIDAIPLVRLGVATALDGADGVDLVASAGTCGDFSAKVGVRDVDTILIDPWGRPASGTSALVALRESYPDCHIVVLSDVVSPDHVRNCMECHASGYIDKSMNPIDLPALLRQARNGQTIMPAIPSPMRHPLTMRELEVLRLASSGLSNADIAARLWVTEQTTKFHLGNIYRKLGVRNRTEAAHVALRDGLIS